MNTKTVIIFIFILVNINGFLMAQSESLTESKNQLLSDWQVGLYLGMSSYEGDVHCFKEEEINVFTEANFAFGLNLYKKVSDRFGLGLQYLNTSFSGSDAAFTSGKGHRERGFSFNNNISELSIVMKYEPFGNKPWKVSPYISGGLGFVFGEADTDYSRANQPAFREQLILKDISSRSSSSIGFPLGLGIVFTVTDKVSINFDAALRFGLNDYIDGVSNSGNASVNDYFGTGGIVISYHLGEPKSKFVNKIKEY